MFDLPEPQVDQENGKKEIGAYFGNVVGRGGASADDRHTRDLIPSPCAKSTKSSRLRSDPKSSKSS